MAACLSSGGGGRPYQLDMIKPISTSPARSSHSSPSSTISDSNSSNSNSSISIKKPRAPRKRPNQTYNEAAALLSSIYPSIFNPKTTLKPIYKRPNKQPQLDPLSFDDVPDNDDENSVLLPPLRVPGPAAFLLHDPVLVSEFVLPLPSPSIIKRYSFRDPGIGSPVTTSSSLSLNSEVLDDDFDAESILDEEAIACSGEGIDSIMGTLSVDSSGTGTGTSSASHNKHNDSGGAVLASNLNSNLNNPCLKNLVGLGLSSKLEQFNKAFKNRGNGTDWYQSPAVPMKEIFTKFKPPAVATEKKKSSKKKKIENIKGEKEKREKDAIAGAKQLALCNNAVNVSQAEKDVVAVAPRVKLGLKLNHDDVINAWSDRGSLFSSDGPDSPPPSAETLANIDLSLEGGPHGVREASVMRYKEKRRTRLFSKKIRYQVRKVNADQRPRMKASGRFVRSPSLLQQALEEEKLGG